METIVFVIVCMLLLLGLFFAFKITYNRGFVNGSSKRYQTFCDKYGKDWIQEFMELRAKHGKDLITCPECKQKVSPKGSACLSCGFILEKTNVQTV